MPVFVDAAKNTALTALVGLGAYASLHSAYSATGTNELTGGSPAYARQAIAWDAASGGVVSLTGTESFNVPAGATVAWLGLWSAVTTGTFYGMIPNGGFAPKPFVGATSDTLTAPGHGLSNGQRVVVLAAGSTLPTGLTEGTIYWVISVSGDAFSLSTTQGGSAVDLTAAGSGIVQRIAPEAYELQGTFEVSDINITAAA
ncbi:hypothetical protein MXD61_06790 [Frankia sp. AgPm24]|uniref:hypothetical protein n=1 Tax=Frankia sp. AgPm24 TaxID=631128 RepID=UPI00200C6251|nr:hypothetical protein [Frankia sp. AgPm24]MCK9921597.1 hypothetical protein [Frankia sp. AgPm24]